MALRNATLIFYSVYSSACSRGRDLTCCWRTRATAGGVWRHAHAAARTDKGKGAASSLETIFPPKLFSRKAESRISTMKEDDERLTASSSDFHLAIKLKPTALLKVAGSKQEFYRGNTGPPELKQTDTPTEDVRRSCQELGGVWGKVDLKPKKEVDWMMAVRAATVKHGRRCKRQLSSSRSSTTPSLECFHTVLLLRPDR